MEKLYPKNLNIFVNNVQKNINRCEAMAYFSEFGEIGRIQLPMNAEDGYETNKGYMYVKCKEASTYKKILEGKHEKLGAQVTLRPYFEKGDIKRLFNLQKSNTIIFLKDIPSFISNEELKSHFSKYGPVKAAYAIKGSKENKKMFFGYVQFKNEESIEKLPAKNITIQENLITWKKFSSKMKMVLVGNNDSKSPVIRSKKRTQGLNKDFHRRVKMVRENLNQNHNFANLKYIRIFSYTPSFSKWVKLARSINPDASGNNETFHQ